MKQLPDLEGVANSGAERDRMDVALSVLLSNLYNSLQCMQMCCVKLCDCVRYCANLPMEYILQINSGELKSSIALCIDLQF